MTATEKLFAHRLLDSPQAVREFDAALGEIGQRGVGAAELPDLLRCFDDATQQHDVMWGLVHLVDRAPPRALVDTLLGEADRMARGASGWLFPLVARILNSPEHNGLFVAAFQNSSMETRAALRRTLERVGKSPAPGAGTATELLHVTSR